MADTEKQPERAADAKADAMALAEQAEAEAAEAEALAAAARARARAIRLRREAEAQAQNQAEDTEADDAETEDSETAAAETDEASPEPAEPPEPAATAAPSGRRWLRAPKVATALTAAAIVVICALLGASGYMMWHHHTVGQQRQQDAAFAAAAKQGVVNMMSLDFHKAKEDVQRVIDSSTGEFRDDFQKRAADFTSVVEQSKVVTEGSAKTAAIESVGKDSAVVLVLANERVTNSAGAKEEPRTFRLRVTVAREGDQIKMSKVEFVL
jgi:Mce-associated membrane protein